MVYGYLAPARPVPAPRRSRYESYSCQDCQWVEDYGDAQGCGRHRGNPRN